MQKSKRSLKDIHENGVIYLFNGKWLVLDNEKEDSKISV